MATDVEVAVLEFGRYLHALRERSPTVLTRGIALLAEEGPCRAIATAAFRTRSAGGRGWTRTADAVSQNLLKSYAARTGDPPQSARMPLEQVANRAGHLMVLQTARELAACCAHVEALAELRQQLDKGQRLETATSMLAEGGLFRPVCRLVIDHNWDRREVRDLLAEAVVTGTLRWVELPRLTGCSEGPEGSHLWAFSRRVADLIVLAAFRELVARLKAISD